MNYECLCIGLCAFSFISLAASLFTVFSRKRDRFNYVKNSANVNWSWGWGFLGTFMLFLCLSLPLSIVSFAEEENAEEVVHLFVQGIFDSVIKSNDQPMVSDTELVEFNEVAAPIHSGVARITLDLSLLVTVAEPHLNWIEDPTSVMAYNSLMSYLVDRVNDHPENLGVIEYLLELGVELPPHAVDLRGLWDIEVECAGPETQPDYLWPTGVDQEYSMFDKIFIFIMDVSALLTFYYILYIIAPPFTK